MKKKRRIIIEVKSVEDLPPGTLKSPPKKPARPRKPIDPSRN